MLADHIFAQIYRYSETMEILFNKLFIACVNAIYWLESVSGVSYEAWNLALFVFLQPLLIVLFFLLWMRARNKVGITDLRFHDLRHEAVSRFFEMGMSVPEVALISGHKDVRQLFRYSHLNPENVFKKYAAF